MLAYTCHAHVQYVSILARQVDLVKASVKLYGNVSTSVSKPHALQSSHVLTEM